MWYRREFHTPTSAPNARLLLHFGAVDWQTSVWVNGQHVGNHTGGYDGFSFDVTAAVHGKDTNEVLVYVYDPSDFGRQVFGKQRISAIDSASGDTYTPSSGIWQTVWLEEVPQVYVRSTPPSG